MVSFEFMQFPLFSPLFVLFSFTRVLLSFLLFIHGGAGWSFQSKKKKKIQKKNKPKQLHYPPTGQCGGWRPHGDQSDMRTTGVSLKCSPRCLRKEQWGQSERGRGKGNHLAQTSLTKKKIQANHLWSPWKLACNPSSHLLMKPQSPFINLLKNLFSEDS